MQKNDNKFPDMIFVSMENWDEVWRRNLFVCSKLAKRFPDSKILFCGLPNDISRSMRIGSFRELSYPSTWTVPGYSNIIVTRPPKIVPNRFKWARKVNEIIFRTHVCNVAKKIGIKDPILWLNAHYSVHMAGKMKERMIVYDITDDWALMAGQSQKEKTLISYQDRELCKIADIVIVCSKALEESRKPLCKKILLLPNGVDVDHYKNALKSNKGRNKRKWPVPVFGYTGTIDSYRIDINIIVALARAFPGGSVVLAGPIYLGNKETSLLTRERNIHLTGAIPYANIVDYVKDFDVCIAPYMESGFADSLNPLKLWEYLACGKPIVSTNISSFRDFRHLCCVVSGVDEFISACRAALSENDKLVLSRISEAEKNSWNARIDCLVHNLMD